MEREIDFLVTRFIKKYFPGKVGSGAAKLPEEVKEFIEEPTLEEAADVLICVLVELNQRGWSISDLLIATKEKLEINEKRMFVLQPDGTIHHVD